MRCEVLRLTMALSVSVVVVGSTAIAHADVSGVSADALVLPVPARLVGTVLSPGRSMGRAQDGVFIGVDGGYSVMLPSDTDTAHGAWSFGARLGYEFRNGLSVFGRYDDLGVTVVPGASPLQVGSAGFRYSLPWIVLPFGEAMMGAAFQGADARFCGAVGLGLSFPIGRHLAFDLSFRDWLTPEAGEVRQTLTVGLGASVTFAGR